MVLRKAYDTVNKIGGAWVNINQGIYNSPVKAARENAQVTRGSDEARMLLEEVVADWPAALTETPAIRAARDYLRRGE